jgi:hypothetical protein
MRLPSKATAALVFLPLIVVVATGCKDTKKAPDAQVGSGGSGGPGGSTLYAPEDLVVGEPGHQVSLGPSLALPSGWPTDVPLYPSAHVSSVQVGDASDGTTLMFETKDAPSVVETFYRTKLASMPVQLDIGMSGPMTARTLVVKSPTHTVSVFVTRVYGDTRVTLAVVPS